MRFARCARSEIECAPPMLPSPAPATVMSNPTRNQSRFVCISLLLRSYVFLDGRRRGGPQLLVPTVILIILLGIHIDRYTGTKRLAADKQRPRVIVKDLGQSGGRDGRFPKKANTH